MKFVLDREENIEGKGANAGYQYFLLSPPSFQKSSSLGSLKVVIPFPHNDDLTPLRKKSLEKIV